MNVTLVAAIFCMSFLNTNPEWEMVRESDEIKVYKAATDEGFDAIKIEVAVSASLEDFVAFINDADSYTLWVYGCSYSKTISKLDSNILFYETVTDMPFPIQDRYLKVKSTQILSESEWNSHSIALPAEKSDMVVITNFDSRWHVVELPNHTISISYVVKTEPGGFIPAWLYNLAVDRGPYNTMMNLKNTLELKKNKNIIASK